jgi:hypothetical protein
MQKKNIKIETALMCNKCTMYNGRAITRDVAGMITNNYCTGEELPIVDWCWEFQ